MSGEPQDITTDNRRRGRRFWVGVLALSIGVIMLIAAGFFIATTYIFHTGREESAQDEAAAILVGIYDAEAAYYERHECYEADPEEIGYAPARKPRYYAWAVVHAGCGGYIARVWGNLDDDDALDIWEITDYDRRKPMHVFSDELDQGYAIDPESGENWRPADGVLLFPAGRRD